ncbi:MAG: PrsW family intramembrane metalloprotease, partial [Bacteroidales bacterium]|nr:PrsW family intramembrane metalloprotease [Bacteroidales bacterium]
MISVIGLAILPALILLYYVYQQDKLQREPTKNLVRAFFYGGASVFASLLISVPFMNIGLVPQEIHSFADAFRTAFFGAAIPEETAKLVLLFLFLRKCRDFDERMDGIVYGACVGLGFAS